MRIGEHQRPDPLRAEFRHATRELSRLAARVEQTLFAATLAAMAYLYLGPLLAQAI